MEKQEFRKSELNYGDVCRSLYGNQQFYYLTRDGFVDHSDIYTLMSGGNTANTREQLECIIARNKLANVAKYFNNGWKPSNGDPYTTLEYFYGSGDVLAVPNVWRGESAYGEIIFKNENDAWDAIKLLGVETCKRAVMPLGV